MSSLRVGQLRYKIGSLSRVRRGIAIHRDKIDSLLRINLPTNLFDFSIVGGRSTMTDTMSRLGFFRMSSSNHVCHSVYQDVDLRNPHG